LSDMRFATLLALASETGTVGGCIYLLVCAQDGLDEHRK
jgi:hypothetical protein